MKRIYKKAISVFLVVAMLLCAAPLSGFVGLELPSFFDFKAEAATYSGTCGDNLTWTLDTETGVLDITGTGAMTNWALYSFAPWRSSSKNTNIKKVHIESGVTSIGDYAFYNCINLTTIEIPESVTRIGKSAFNGCGSMTDVHYDGIEGQWNSISIGNGNVSFLDATKHFKHTHIMNTIAESVEPTCTEDGYITGTCKCGHSFTQVIPARHDWSESDYVCSRCDLVCDHTECDGTICEICGKEFVIQGVFADGFIWICDLNTKTLTISGTGSMMNECPWEEYKNSIQRIVINNGVTDIGVGSFGACNNLINVVIPESVISIGDGAFTECSVLTDVFYGGTEERWSGISIGDGNNDLLNATRYYNTAGICGDNVVWIYDADTKSLTIEGTGEMYDFLQDEQPWLAYRENVKRAVISEGITNVGDYTFDFCRYLTKVTLPSTITTIGEGAFLACYNISGIVIPDSVTTIENRAFASCTGLLSLTIPDGVTSIGNHVFDYCIALKSITIPESVKSIGNAAFQYCQRLKNITLPSGITTIGSSMFRNCEVLESIEIPAGVTSIGSYAFGDCYELSEIVLPETLPEISAGMFYNCDDITELRIHDGATSIGSSAFGGCLDLRSITIPGSVKLIDEEAFVSCERLKDVYYIGTESQWNKIKIYTFYNEDLLNATRHYIVTDTCGDNLTWTYDLSTQTLRISGEGAMYDYSSGSYPWEDYKSLIRTVIIEDGITSISNYAFAYCNNLMSVTIHDSVTTIGNYAFAYCDNLMSVAIPDSVTTIGNYAFAGCSNLTSVIIGNGVANIGYGSFLYCVKLTSIVVDEDNQYYSSDSVGALFDKDKTMLIQYPVSNTRISYTIPGGVTIIGDSAFNCCSNLTSITIPDSVTIIGSSAFGSCSALNDIYYGSTQEDWNKITINSDNDYLTDATIHFTEPESVVKSGKCGDNLTWTLDTQTGELTISGTGKMTNWSSYPDVPWYSFKSAIKSVKINDGVTSIGKYAFHYHESLENVKISDSVTSIGGGAFSDCDNLESIMIPSGVIYINQYAFDSCGNLKIITISDSVTDIGYAAFDRCYDIADVYYMGSEEQWNEINNGDFNNCLLGATIHYGHIHSMNTIEESVASTCTQKGYKNGTCICEYKYKEALPLLEHDIIIDKAVEATCTETGLTQGQHCSRCDDATIEQEVVPALNHKDTLVQVDAKAPTCTEFGWDDYEYCTACDYTTYVEKKALEHDIVIDEAVDSTCSETGLTQGQHCSRCDDMTIEQEVIPTKPHNHTAMYDSAKHWKECICGSIIEEQNHSFIDGNICSCGYERTIDVAIAIKNNSGSRTINYGETLELTAIVSDTANVPENAVVEWYVDGVKSGEGETFRIKFESGTKTVEVKLEDENGVVYQDTTKSEISDSENVTVKAGFFQKLISFFKNLFGISRIILQSI